MNKRLRSLAAGTAMITAAPLLLVVTSSPATEPVSAGLASTVNGIAQGLRNTG